MDIEILRNICLSFRSVTENVKWGNDLCFCIGGKMFCVASLEPPHTFSFKITKDEFDEISQTEGFKPAPYLARANWVLVTDPSRMNKKELESYLRKSYEMILSKISRKAQIELGIK